MRKTLSSDERNPAYQNRAPSLENMLTAWKQVCPAQTGSEARAVGFQTLTAES